MAAKEIIYDTQARNEVLAGVNTLAPVGSSATINFGSPTTARATATRCC